MAELTTRYLRAMPRNMRTNVPIRVRMTPRSTRPSGALFGGWAGATLVITGLVAFGAVAFFEDMMMMWVTVMFVCCGVWWSVIDCFWLLTFNFPAINEKRNLDD